MQAKGSLAPGRPKTAPAYGKVSGRQQTVDRCYDNVTMTRQPSGTAKQVSRQGEEPAIRNFALNRQAGHYYHLLEKFEAGIELSGTEVKSIRDGKANLKDSYAVVKDGQAWLINCHIGAYSPGSYLNHDSLRDRRLLLHRREIDKLAGRAQEKGLTLIPLRLYVKNNLIKCEIALAKRKTLWDQRETIRRRTADRETQQEIREHRKKQ